MNKLQRTIIKTAEDLIGGCHNATARDFAWAIDTKIGQGYDKGIYEERIDNMWEELHIEDAVNEALCDEDIGFLCEVCGWYCSMCDQSWDKVDHCSDCKGEEDND